MSSQIEIDKKIINYLSVYSYRPDPITEELVIETRKLGNISAMQIAPEQSQFLELLTKLISAKKCLEIGRFTGLSALSLAKGVPEDGKIIAIDNSEEFLPIAKKYWNKAGVEQKIESITGQGIDVLKKFILKNMIFDLIFIDADKKNYNEYYELSLKILKTNGLLIIDNVLWDGEVANKSIFDETTKCIHLLNEKIKNDNRVDFIILPQADGISLIRKK